MLKNVFTKIDLLDFHTTLQKGRGASGSSHSMVGSHGEAESDEAEGFFPSLLREGLDNLAGLPAQTKEAPSLSSGKATERFLAQTQQKETASDVESGGVAEKDVALSAKLLTADRAAGAAVPVIAKNSEDGEPIPFPVAGQMSDKADGEDAAVEKGFGSEKVFDARWFAFGRQNDFWGPVPGRRPLAHVAENQEAMIGSSERASGVSLAASSVGVRDGKTVRFPVDQERENFAPREPLTVAADSKGEPADAVPESLRDMTPSARGDQGDKRASASSFAPASTVGVRDGKTVRFPVDHERESIAPREPLTSAADSKGKPADAVPGSLRDMTPSARGDQGDKRAAAASFASASSVGVRDGKTVRFPVDQERENLAPREPLTVAADSKGEPAEVVPGSLRDMTPSARGDQGDKQASASSFAPASTVGVRDGETVRFPVDQERENFGPREPLTVAADSKGKPAEVVPGNLRDMTPSAMREENAKRASAAFFPRASEVVEGAFTAKDENASIQNDRMDSRRFSEKDTVVGRRLYDFSGKQGETESQLADEGSFAARKGHETDVKLSNSFDGSIASEETASVVRRNALDRQNVEMVSNARAERVLPKGAGETIPAVVYEGTAAAGDVLPRKNLDRESLLRDAENRFSSRADFDAVENSGSTILKEAVSSSGKAQKEKSNLSSNEFSSRLAENGATDIQATLSGRQVFSVEDSRPLESRTIAEQVMSQMPEDAFKSANRVRINLYPESLGKLDMEIVVRENRVHVFIIADRTDVVQALHGQQEQLKNALQSQGLQVSSLDFQWRENSSPLDDGSRGGDLWRHQNQGREQRQGRNEEDPVIAGNPGVLTGNVMRTQPLERTISVFV